MAESTGATGRYCTDFFVGGRGVESGEVGFGVEVGSNEGGIGCDL
jgi:hypothetical protein